MDVKLWQFVGATGEWIATSYGMPQMTGRVLDWLLVCDPTEQTAAQPAEAPGAAGGAGRVLRLVELWRVVDELRREGTTVLRTTQYLEEADRLAQRIAVVDHGRIAAQGTPTELKAAIGGHLLSVRLADPTDVPRASAVLSSLATGEQPRVDSEREHASGEIRLAVADPSASAEARRRLDAQALPIRSVDVQQPGLDDVFLTLT